MCHMWCFGGGSKPRVAFLRITPKVVLGVQVIEVLTHRATRWLMMAQTSMVGNL